MDIITDVTATDALVSVLLPTYNRARFLPAALRSIASQAYTNWELVIVDDGSSDDTESVVAAMTRGLAQRVTYLKQPNAGAYGARNTALDHARGAYVAFYDSDDVWLPNHLADSVRALDDAPDVDWVYAACRTVDHETGQVIDPDTFVLNGRPRPFRQLRVEQHGALSVFADEHVVESALTDGLYCGLQNSVIRARVFAQARFQAAYRNEAEDQLFVIRSLKRGHRMGYLNAIHVQYHVHSANSSASAKGQTVDRELSVYRPLARGFEELQHECAWTARERRALRRRIAREHFWHIGYAVLWARGRRREALDAFGQGLRHWPWDPGCWKVYLLARVRTFATGDVAPAVDSGRGART